MKLLNKNKNKKFIKIALVGAVAFAMTGCTSRSVFGTTEERTMLNAEQFSDYDLSNEEDYNHSEAMQLMHLVTRASVYSANNLDKNADGYNNVAVRTTQLANVAATATSTLNPFQAAFNIIGSQSNLSKMSIRYRGNILFKVVPIKNLDNTEITKILKDTQDELSRMVYEAYDSSPGINYVKTMNPKDEGLATFLNDTFVIPFTSDDNVAYCLDGKLYDKYQAYLTQPDFEPGKYLPGNTYNCFAYANSKAHYYYNDTNSTNSAYLPKSDFIVQIAYLPITFPYHHLKSVSDSVFYYQPALSYIRDSNLKFMLKTDSSSVEKLWNEGYFSEKPRVIQVSTKTELNFGQ